MRRHVLTVGVLILGAVLLAGLWKLNVKFGTRIGEIDRGRWYLIQGSSDQYYQKGVDPDNQLIDYQEVERMIAETPGYLRTEQGFGAIWIQKGWLSDPFLSSSGWKLFSTEADAAEFLRKNGVEERDVRFVYK